MFDQIIQALDDLPTDLKGLLMSTVAGLTPAQQQQLATTLRGATDATAASLLVAFLASQGLVPAILGAGLVSQAQRPAYLPSYLPTQSSAFL